MTISEKVAYIQGMFVGMELDKSEMKVARVLSEVLDVLQEMGQQLDGMDTAMDQFATSRSSPQVGQGISKKSSSSSPPSKPASPSSSSSNTTSPFSGVFPRMAKSCSTVTKWKPLAISASTT